MDTEVYASCLMMDDMGRVSIGRHLIQNEIRKIFMNEVKVM